MSATVRCKFAPAPRPAPGRAVLKAARPRKPTGPSRAARMLALAYYIERQIEDGAVPDYAAAACALGVTRARVTQLMNLLLLAPEIQGRIVAGELPISERDLRRAVGEPEWEEQHTLVQQIGGGLSS